MFLTRSARDFVLRIAVGIVSITSVHACQQSQDDGDATDSAQAVQQVEETVEAWFNDAIATLDTAVIGSYLTPTFGSTEPVGWLDKQAFLEWITTFEEDFGGPFTLGYTLYDWHTTVRGDVAWTNMMNDGTLWVEGEAPQYMKWAESGVLVKQPDGRWLIDRYHSTFLGFQEPDSTAQ